MLYINEEEKRATGLLQKAKCGNVPMDKDAILKMKIKVLIDRRICNGWKEDLGRFFLLYGWLLFGKEGGCTTSREKNMCENLNVGVRNMGIRAISGVRDDMRC